MFAAILKMYGLDREFIVFSKTDISINFLKHIHPRSECIVLIIFEHLLAIEGFTWSTVKFSRSITKHCA